MVGASSNIYVSVAKGYAQAEGKDENGYRRTQNTWMISVDSRKHSIPLVHRHKNEPVHFTATRNDEDDSYIVTQASSADGIIGTILIAEGAHCSAEHVLQALAVGLRSTKSNLPSEQAPEGESDRWVRKGLHVLQAHKMIEAFDVGEFFTFAHAYVADRLEHEAPSMITYPGLHKGQEKKSQKTGFWISHPMSTSARRYDAESRLYGGLM